MSLLKYKSTILYYTLLEVKWFHGILVEKSRQYQVVKFGTLLHECSCCIEFTRKSLVKAIKCDACKAFHRLFEALLINSILKDFIYHMTSNELKSHFFA